MRAIDFITTSFICATLILAGSLAKAGEAQKTSDWPTFRANGARTGTLDAKPGPKFPVDAIWAVTDPETAIGDVSPSPVVVDGRVYTAGSFTSVFFRGGHIYCLDARNGNILWKYKTAQQVFSSPAVVGGRLFCGEGYHTDGNSKMYCIDAKSGNEIWTFQTRSHLESSPAVDGGHVFFGAGDDGLYCITADQGKEVWHFPNVHVDVAPAVDDKHVYFGTGYGELGIYCVDRKTGKKVWSLPTPHGAWGTPSIVGDEMFYATGNGTFYESAPESERTGRVICCDRNSGNEGWHFDVGDGVLSAIAVQAERVYFGCRDGNVYCLNRETGKQIWKCETGGPVVSSPALDGNMVFIGSDDGSMYGIDAASGDLKWFYDTTEKAPDSKIWSSPALADGRLYFGTTASYIFCLGTVEGDTAM